MNFCIFCGNDENGYHYMICRTCELRDEIRMTKKIGYENGVEYGVLEAKMDILTSPHTLKLFPHPPEKIKIPNNSYESYWYKLNFNIGYHDGYNFIKRQHNLKNIIHFDLEEIYTSKMTSIYILSKYKNNEFFDPNILKIVKQFQLCLTSNFE